MTRIAVVGAGLAGSLLATLLGRRGLEVDLYERRSDPRVGQVERGRSINLALSARGLAALEAVGLRERVLRDALPMPGRMVHPIDGPANFQPYSADGTQAIHSIGRSGLNNAMLDAATETPGVRAHFGHKLEAVDLDAGTLTFEDRVVEADVILGADGAYSATRRAMLFRSGFTYSQDYLTHGYKELVIPPKDGEFAIDPGALHIWARGTAMMIALPNLDKTFTCTLFWPHEGPGSFGELDSPAKILAHFRAVYPDVVDLMPTLVDDYEYNPIGQLVTVRSFPWTARGERAGLALVGDAAHAIVPFFGQGANCAFEDTIEIDRLLDVHSGDWDKVFVDYQVNRKPNTDAIADLALDNFIEMRDRVNSPFFKAKSAAVHAIERRVPAYTSRYELVSFSTMPYADIAGRIRRQNLIGAGLLGVSAAAAAALWRRARRA